MLNSFTELLLPDKGNTFLFDKNKPFGQTATFGIARAIPESGECFCILLLFKIKYLRPVVVQGNKRVAINATFAGLIPKRANYISI